MSRHLAELLVDGGFVSRKEAEAALRESRRNGHTLTQVLTRPGTMKRRVAIATRHLESLLAKNHGGMRLSELLTSSGTLSRREMKRVFDTTRRTGRPLGDVLLSDGYLGRRSHHHKKAIVRRVGTAAVGTAVLFGTMGMMQKPGTAKPALARATSPKVAAPAYPPGTDLRFASLGDVSEQLRQLRRPDFHRAPRVPVRIQLRWRKYREMVELYATQYQLPPELIFAVIEQESKFNPHARSHANAVGLMQIVPHEAGRAAFSYVQRRMATPTVEELFDPQTNIQLGTAYLRLLIDTYFSDIRDKDIRIAITLAAYNWGPGNMLEALGNSGVPGTMEELDRMLRKHAPKETRNYVRSITRRIEVFS